MNNRKEPNFRNQTSGRRLGAHPLQTFDPGCPVSRAQSPSCCSPSLSHFRSPYLIASITLALSKIALRQNTHSLKDNLIETARLKLEDEQAEEEIGEEKKSKSKRKKKYWDVVWNKDGDDDMMEKLIGCRPIRRRSKKRKGGKVHSCRRGHVGSEP
ncbi:hypothetical protein C1H46_035883 [Malus baccata]|uniref:Uncharacterized protein n=1 Tax=Malus baccata TaxID=106549 RepID=A0A540KWR6_MALBA|nr:hypothetical protein C1H46_035883 [Malus baccata]